MIVKDKVRFTSLPLKQKHPHLQVTAEDAPKAFKKLVAEQTQRKTEDAWALATE